MLTIKGTLATNELDIINEVYETFFKGMDITIKLDRRIVKSTSGSVRYNGNGGNILIHTRHYFYKHTPNSILSTISHELGHIHHKCMLPDDYRRCTDYAQELYADDFSAMVMGALWSDNMRSNYKVYTGYKTNKLTK